MEITAMLHASNQPGIEVNIPIAAHGNNAVLRPIVQLAVELERKRKDAGARVMLCERYAEGALIATSGVELIQLHRVELDLSSGRAPRVVLMSKDTLQKTVRVVIDNITAYQQACDLIDGGCLYCGLATRSGCGMCKPAEQQTAEASSEAEALPA